MCIAPVLLIAASAGELILPGVGPILIATSDRSVRLRAGAYIRNRYNNEERLCFSVYIQIRRRRLL